MTPTAMKISPPLGERAPSSYYEFEFLADEKNSIISEIRSLRLSNRVLNKRLEIMQNDYKTDINHDIEFYRRYCSDQTVTLNAQRRLNSMDELSASQRELSELIEHESAVNSLFSVSAVTRMRKELAMQSQERSILKKDIEVLRGRISETIRELNERSFCDQISDVTEKKLIQKAAKEELAEQTKQTHILIGELHTQSISPDNSSDLALQLENLKKKLVEARRVKSVRNSELKTLKASAQKPSLGVQMVGESEPSLFRETEVKSIAPGIDCRNDSIFTA